MYIIMGVPYTQVYIKLYVYMYENCNFLFKQNSYKNHCFCLVAGVAATVAAAVAAAVAPRVVLDLDVVLVGSAVFLGPFTGGGRLSKFREACACLFTIDLGPEPAAAYCLGGDFLPFVGVLRWDFGSFAVGNFFFGDFVGASSSPSSSKSN
jgi:hypothetical protein